MADLNNDIEKYLRGELTAAEMHALEQKALQDPFLAEALEGAEHAGADNFIFDLHQINKSVKEKTKRKPRIIDINGWQLYTGIAAGLLLLALTTYTILMMIDQQRDKTQLAEAKQSAALADTVKKSPAETPVEEKKTDNSKDESDLETSGTKNEKPAVTKPKDEFLALNDKAKSRKTGTEPPADQAIAEAPVITEKTMEKPIAKEDEIASAVTEVETKEEIAKAETKQPVTDYISSGDRDAKKKSAQIRSSGELSRSKDAVIQNTAQVITGKVTSDGVGIPGVNIIIKGTATGTVTDTQGNYQITVPGGSDKLEFAFIGYQSQEANISSTKNNQINVELQNDVTALSEVVVTGYAKSDDTPTPYTFDMAYPEGGKKAFNKYLEANVKYPQQALVDKVEGKVTIQFTVQPSGTLTDFIVIKGIGSGCEEELIRVIKSGPAWQPTRVSDAPVADQVKVRYKFQLPK